MAMSGQVTMIKEATRLALFGPVMASTRTQRAASTKSTRTTKVAAPEVGPGFGLFATAIRTLSAAGGSTASVSLGIADALCQLECDHAVVMHWHSENDAIDAHGSAKLTSDHLLAIELTFMPLAKGLTAGTVDDVGVRHIPGLGAHSARVAMLEPDGDVRSVLILLQAGEPRWHANFGEFLRDCAVLVELVLRNVRADEENRHRRSERRLIARLTQTIVAMQGIHPVFHEVATSIRHLSEWDACDVAIHAVDEDALTIEAMSPPGAIGGLWGDRICLGEWPGLRFALDNCSPYRLCLDQPESITAREGEAMTTNGVATIVALPFAVNTDALGLILLTSATVRRIDSQTLKTIEEVCINTALAVQHHQYVDQARIQAEEQAALIRVSQASISGRDLKSILGEITRVCLGFEGVEGARILMWQKEHDRFEVAAVQHVRDWQMYYRTGDRYPTGDWPSVKSVMQSRVPRGLLVSDSEVTARERYNHAADHIQSFHSFPIIVEENAVGVLTLLSRHKRRMSSNAIRIGREMAIQAAHAIDRARLFGQLRQRAETDGLTGLLNHRAAFETLDRELAVAKAQRQSASIIVLDLDDFKFFNDTHGHLTGDKVLVEISDALREIARPRDHVARFGGDEFLLILPDSNREVAASVADKLLQRMEQAIVSVGDMLLPIRTSVGVATYPNDANTRQELIAYADAAMYSAKELGGGQLGAVDRGTRSLEVTVFGALSGLVRAVDRKDRYTKDHSDLVAEYAVRFGRYLQLPADHIEALDVAGQLHDVGKIAVPDSVLRKPGRLNPDEEALIRQHVVFSELIIKGIPNLGFVLEAVANHHERWDGLGYPYNRQGEEIPLLGRILTLADSLAAMTHDRPYRKARTMDDAVIEIRKGAGTQFDPDLVEPFIGSVTTGSAILREVNRRKRFQTFEMSEDPEAVPVGLTDFLRMRAEKRESDRLSSA